MIEKASPLLAAPPRAAWAQQRERGSPFLLRVMAYVSLRLGRPFSRCFLCGIALYFFLFAPAARRSSNAYLRLALGRAPTARDRFRHILTFATTIHDRVYLANGQCEKFKISVAGADAMMNHLRGRGAMLLGAHMGSFEVMRSVGRLYGGIRVTMAMYEDNARKINSILAAINPAMEPDIVSLGRVGAMLDIAARLDQGAFVGVLGDRTLEDRTAGHRTVGENTVGDGTCRRENEQAVTLLGKSVHLPLGPLRAAAILRCPVYFMAGLYRGKNEYHVVFAKVADFSQVAAGEKRSAAITAAMEKYASLLDEYCRSDPYNWFNFFDFWHAES